MSKLNKADISLGTHISAPCDLVWEYVIEGSYEPKKCPISGLVGGDILEEFEDGILRLVVFDGIPMKQRVYINDELYRLTTESISTDGSVRTNTEVKEVVNAADAASPPLRFLTKIEIEVEWNAEGLEDKHVKSLQAQYEERLERFKGQVEKTWAEAHQTDDSPEARSNAARHQ